MGATRSAGARGWAFSPLGFLRRVAVSTFEDHLMFLASALAFDALLAALPLVLLVLAVMGYLAHSSVGAEASDLHRIFQRFLPAHPAAPADPFAGVERLFVAVVEARGRLSVYGVPLFLWFATRLLGSVRVALNEVFDTDESRTLLACLGLDLVLVLACGVLFVASALISASPLLLPWFGRSLASLSAFGFGVLSFGLIYKVAPSRRVRWDTAIVAASVASLGFELAKRLYAFYLSEYTTLDRLFSNTNVIAVLLFVLWVYYTACVFLVGGEVAETYDLARRQREQRAMLG